MENVSATSQDLHCIRCGYNLRGAVSDRCPECGALLKDAPPSAVRLPWEHRRHLGLSRGYWRTVWIVLFRPKQLAEELHHPVSFPDARRFWGMTILFAWLPFVAGICVLYACTTAKDSPWKDVAWPFPWLYFPVSPVVSLLVGLLAFFAAATGAPSYFCHPRRMPITLQNRAIALSYYASAPLALLAPATALAIGGFLLRPFWSGPGNGLMLAGVALGGVVLLLWYSRVVGLVCRLTGRGKIGRAMVGMAILLIWLILAGLLIGVLSALLHVTMGLIYSLLWR